MGWGIRKLLTDNVWNVSASTLTTMLQGLVNFVTLVYLARILQPTGYGVYSATWVLAGMFAAIGSFGVPQLFLRQLSQQSQVSSATVGQALSLLSMLSGATAIVFLGVVYSIPVLAHQAALYDVWVLVILQVMGSPIWLYSVLKHLWVANVINLVANVVRLWLSVVLVHSPHDLMRAVVITAGSLMISTVVQWLWVRRWVRLRWQWVSLTSLVHTVRASIPLGVLSMVGITYSGLDVWILHEFVGVQAVGYYAVAYRPLAFLLTFSTLYFNLAFPIVGALDDSALRQALRVVVIVVAMFLAPLTVGSDVLAPSLIVGVFGSQYHASITVFQVLIWSWSLSLIRDVFVVGLIARHREKIFAMLYGGTGLLNVGLMLGLVHWGPVGAASALVITQAVLLVAVLKVSRRMALLPSFPSLAKYLLNILVSSCTMAVAVWWIRTMLPWWIAAVFGVGIYFSALMVSRMIPDLWADLHNRASSLK